MITRTQSKEFIDFIQHSTVFSITVSINTVEPCRKATLKSPKGGLHRTVVCGEGFGQTIYSWV